MSKQHSGATLIILILLYGVLPASSNAAQSMEYNSLPLEEGTIEAAGQSYRYEKSYYLINVYDTHNRPVFQVTNDDVNALLLDFDYSRVLNRFVVFKLDLNPQDTTFTFSMEGNKFYREILVDVAYPVYNPILVENDNDEVTVLYITDEPALVAYDVRSHSEISRLKFDKPIYRMRKEKIHDRESVTFFKFDAGKSIPYYFNIKTIAVPQIRKSPLNDTEHEQLESEPIDQPIAVPLIQLDEKTIVGFGDSITYGKIWDREIPHLGYVPRLEQLVNSEFYPSGDGQVLNAGELAEVTEEGLSRFEGIILSYRGKYLLFQEGTNDAIWPDKYPLSYIKANIQHMMQAALKYDIQPIISTLIPRDPSHWTGQGIPRQRAIGISNDIRTLSQQLNIPIVDFWNIFSWYQGLYGWWENEDSVMGDYVHPSEKGYQIMAEEWLKALLSLPPAMPQNLQVVYASSFQATLQWTANKERDFSHYILQYGYSAGQLDLTGTTTDNKYEFLFYPLRPPFRSQIYVRIRAVDQDGNRSDFTPVYTVTFQ